MNSRLLVVSEKEDSRYVPVHIARPLLQECGYRCSVPRCKGTSALQLEHIEDWAKLDFKKHDFDKMIVLCATCHARVTAKEIHKDAMRAYKRNLAVLNGRYSLFEMRLLKFMRDIRVAEDEDTLFQILLSATRSDLIHLSGFLEDGFVQLSDIPPAMNGFENNMPQSQAAGLALMMNKPTVFVHCTHAGQEFAKKYYSGEEI